MKEILYICDRKKCEDCFEECRHTSDKDHAVNPEFDRRRFKEDESGNYWEQSNG